MRTVSCLVEVPRVGELTFFNAVAYTDEEKKAFEDPERVKELRRLVDNESNVGSCRSFFPNRPH